MDWVDINRAAWDARTAVHVDSDFYDVAGFLAGGSALREIELRELTGVQGRSLLHLQCHFGLDTLSWARRGARVTGVDLSPAAIARARALADQTGLDATFLCGDVQGFGERHDTRYDIVFTSYGAVCWLPDIADWARTVARCLKPGGVFYMAEFHPLYDLITGYGYFHRELPDVEEEGTYTDGEAVVARTAVWVHPVADVVSALIAAGITLEFVHEFPFSPYDCFEGLVEREPGRFALEHEGHDVPLVYSVKGRLG